MAKRRGKDIGVLATIERPRTGKHHLLRIADFAPDPPITIHRRGLNVDDYRPPDPREAWATPQSEMPMRGTLPERVVYKALTDRHIEFDFQSSLVGGRLELGGLVADFVIPRPPTIIRVQGLFWHGDFDRETGNLINGELDQGRRDDVQRSILEDMGYWVVDFWENTADDEFLVDSWMHTYVDPIMFGLVEVKVAR